MTKQLKSKYYKTVKVKFIQLDTLKNFVNAYWTIRGRTGKVTGANKEEAFGYAKKYIDIDIIKSLRWKND